METVLAGATTILAAIAVLASYPTLKALYDVVSLLYSLTIHAYIYTYVNMGWLIFYLAIIVMIIKYRQKLES